MVYFQKIWTHTNIVANANEIIDLAANGSFIRYVVIKANTIIPVAKPINRPGHNNPSKYSAQYLVANINKYVTGAAINVIIHGRDAAHSFINWALVVNHITNWPNKKNKAP